MKDLSNEEPDQLQIVEVPNNTTGSLPKVRFEKYKKEIKEEEK